MNLISSLQVRLALSMPALNKNKGKERRRENDLEKECSEYSS